MENKPPPWFPLKLLKWFCNPAYRFDIEGDLLELHDRRVRALGYRKANLLLFKDVLLLCRPGIIRTYYPIGNFINTGMLRHNLILSFRNFVRYKTTFLINLTGLSTGIACALLIWLWVADELSVDKFHLKDNQLYQVLYNHGSSQNIHTWDLTPLPLAAALSEGMPEVEDAVAANESEEGIFLAGDKHAQAKGWYAGNDFFKVFSYDLLHGAKENVLANKDNVVISEGLARKLFDDTDSAIGKTVEWKDPFFEGVFHVTGIFRSPPDNSTAQFDFLISIELLLEKDRWAKEWTGNYAETFLLLREGTDISEFNGKIGGLLKSKNPRLDNSTLFVQRYSDKYLHGRYENGIPSGGRIAYLKLFSIVAVFIVLIACCNFMNLSTAKASLRMKEIGVKKTIGATRNALVTQFLGESLVMTLLSLMTALLLVVLLLPGFNELTGKDLNMAFAPADILVIAVIVLLTGFLAGSYPALYLSGFKPLAVLKGKLTNSAGAILVRKGLVVFQFALSVVFIVGLLVVNEQIKFTQTKNLGYNRDNILCFQWKGELYNQWNGLEEGKSNEIFNRFMLGLKEVAGVVKATHMSGSILNEIYGQSGISWRGQESDRDYIFQSPIVGYDFIETLGLEIIEGRSFLREYHDDYSKIILNEAAVKMMNITDPIGKKIQMNGSDEIIGVVKDFHYGSLHNPIEPLIFRFDPTGRNVLVKIQAGTEQRTIEQLKKFYHEFLPDYAFAFTFMDDDYQTMYESESKVATLSQYFSGIAIIISCLGLFGLASFTTQRRQKEIGIRKVMGASELNIVSMLNGEFIRPVLIAIVISLPASYLIVSTWLSSFAERIDLSWWFFIVAGLLALFIAWLTVGLQTIKAANVNPVECLRDE